MEAQAYSDGLLRIFDKNGKKICDMEFSPSLKREADKQLHKLKLYRRGKWKDCEWGSYARIQFRG